MERKDSAAPEEEEEEERPALVNGLAGEILIAVLLQTSSTSMSTGSRLMAQMAQTTFFLLNIKHFIGKVMLM